MNEFGEVGIDGSLLKDSGSDVVELTSGCICCSLAADLRQSLHDILERFKPWRILIEGSGVADPVSVRTTLVGKDFSGKLTLRKIITVLDADLWEGREIFVWNIRPDLIRHRVGRCRVHRVSARKYNHPSDGSGSAAS